jgi:FtsH-binding integral membrane protein
MAIDPFSQTIHPDRQTTRYDGGLRAYMLKIYNYMAMALVMTGVIAFFSAQSEAFLNAMYAVQDGNIVGMKPLAWLVMIAPLGFVIFLSFGLQRMSLATAQIGYWLYAAIMGLSLSVIFLSFTGESIARVFFITAGTFGGMSLYGYTTKRDLTPVGWFLVMGLIGLIVASLVNLFMQSSGMQFALSVIGVLIFVGLTAYDTQKLKALYYQSSADGEWAAKMGALTLYLDFINIFLNLLSLFGKRRK